MTHNDPKAGDVCTFYSEVLQETLPASERLCRFTGQDVTIVRNLRGYHDADAEYDGPGPDDVVDHTAEDGPGFFPVSRQYLVRAADGTVFAAMVEELNGWDYERGQFYNAAGEYGGKV